MATGTVILFKADKGYGFIKPDDGTSNVYVHISALDGIDLEAFEAGASVTFDTQSRNDKISAVNIALV
jgi:CspA family cold shock protein